jgi:Domain of unknown function (DUF5658)
LKVLFSPKVFPCYILGRMTDTEVAIQGRSSIVQHETTQHQTTLNQLLWQFSYLQVLDFLTTVAFLLNGVHEANPLVRLAFGAGANPVAILLMVKLLAIALGLYCWRRGRRRLLFRINILFALLIAWNLVALIVQSVS